MKDISAIVAYKLKQSKLIIKILKSNQTSYTCLCTLIWLDLLILLASIARHIF